MKRMLKALMSATLVFAMVSVTAHAQPAPPLGELVFTDDFSDATKSGLEDNVNATDFSRGFHAPGVYHLRLQSANDTRMSLLPNRSFATATMEIDLWDNSDDFAGDAAFGVVFRAQDASHLYAVMLDSRKSQYTVRKLDGTTWSDLVPWTDTSLIKPNGEVNQLRVDADGDTFTMYLGDQQLGSFTDGSYAQGGMGMIASNVDAIQPHLHFDNLDVYAAGATGSSPAMLPSTGTSQAPLWPAALCVMLFAGGLLLRRRSPA